MLARASFCLSATLPGFRLGSRKEEKEKQDKHKKEYINIVFERKAQREKKETAKILPFMSPLQRLSTHGTHQHATYSAHHPTAQNLMSEQAPGTGAGNYPESRFSGVTGFLLTIVARIPLTVVTMAIRGRASTGS